MKRLVNKSNVTGATTAFPYGDVRDKTPSLAGTLWDKEMMSDVLQFFEKLMAESGIVANGSLDNFTNGFQLYEALVSASKPYKTIQGSFINGTFTEFYNDTGATVTFNPNGSYQFYDFDITGATFTANKTHVLVSSKATVQGDTNLVVTGGRRFSDTKVRVTVMAFVGMTGSSSGINVNGGSLYPDPVFVEIRVYP